MTAGGRGGRSAPRAPMAPTIAAVRRTGAGALTLALAALAAGGCGQGAPSATAMARVATSTTATSASAASHAAAAPRGTGDPVALVVAPTLLRDAPGGRVVARLSPRTAINRTSHRAGRAATGWAIHGTTDPASVGRAASLGCLRARERDLRRLMGLVGLGSVVEIRA
jgi:hypothetical protein